MSNKYEIVGVGDLDPHDAVRKHFEQRSQGIRQNPETAARPTAIQPSDPSGAIKPVESSGSIKPFCSRCGLNQAEPFGPHLNALKLWIRGSILEVYQPRGVILLDRSPITFAPRWVPTEQSRDEVVIYGADGFAISSHRSKGMGASGRFGYTRTLVMPEN